MPTTFAALLLLLWGQLWPNPGPGRAAVDEGGGSPPAFVSYREGSTSSGTSVATSSAMAVSAGDFIAVAVGWGDPDTILPTTVSDGSNLLTCLAASGASAAVGSVTICYKANAAANGAATWTASWGVSRSFLYIGSANYTGVATASPLDQGPSCNVAGCNAATTANTTQAQNVTTTQASELLIAVSYDNNASNWTAANSFNLRAPTTAGDHMFADRVVASTGSYPGGNFATNSASRDYVSIFATFKGQ